MNVVIFGAGSSGRRAFKFLTSSGHRVVAFSDNNERLFGSKVEGVRVVPPGQIAELDFEKIIIASTFSSVIKRDLTDLGGFAISPDVVEVFDIRKFSDVNSDSLSDSLFSLSEDELYGFMAKNFRSSLDILRIQAFLSESSDLGIRLRALWNCIPYASYAYGVFSAADLAKRLGLTGISVVELGVAGGNGLLALERYAHEVERTLDISIDVYGLDTGVGMPAPRSSKDMPFAFQKGNYRMDEYELRSRLTKAKLRLGDGVEEFSSMISDEALLPIGFISFDMDYYHATFEILKLIGGANGKAFLPRVQAYFDNTSGSELLCYNEFAGELAAIKDFNDLDFFAKVCENRFFRSLPLSFDWYSKMYIIHLFSNEKYDQYVNVADGLSLSLKK